MLKDSNHFCPYYDHGIYIGANANRETLLSMCCWQRSQVVEEPIVFDHPRLLALRQHSKTKIPNACSPYCSQPGHVGNERERSQKESWWKSGQGKIKKLHLEQSLLCNLTCISCSSRYSSAWASKYHEFDSSAPTIRLVKSPDKVWQHLDFSDLEHIHFTGGEPLLNPDNLLVLEHLDKIGRISSVSLSYSTNGTVRPSNRWLELWKKTRWVRLFFSLDGTDSTFEYTRYPAKWGEVDSNIEWFRQQRDACILIEVSGIIGIHNIFNLPDLYNWWKERCQTGSQGDPSQIHIRSIEPDSHGGRVLNLNYLPGCYREAAEEVLHSVKDCPGAIDLFELLCKDESSEWQDYFEKLDSWRGTNWKSDLKLSEIV